MTTVVSSKWFIIFALFLWSGGQNLSAQKAQAMHWYFGDHYGLNFSNGYPETDYSSAQFTFEACTTISDKEGQLLFYTNGGGRANQAICGHIWNRNHEIMDGGNLGFDQGGGYSSAQGAVAFEKPGSDNVYCLLTVDEFETISTSNNNFPKGKGSKYFEIDMNANNGLGQVTLANQHLFTPAFEYQAVTIHENCTDYWWVAPTGHYALLDDPDVADSFYVYLVSGDGPLLEHVIPMPEGHSNMADEYGLIKISPDGTHLICGSHLYQFDNSTGWIQHKEDLLYSIGLDHFTPAAFSPNSRFLYEFSLSPADSISLFRVKQFDLTSDNFSGSVEIIWQSQLTEFAIIGTPQLAIDGKLYFLIQNGFYTSPTSLNLIHNPNIKGPSAGVELNFLTISNIPDSRFLRFGQYSDHIFRYKPELAGSISDSTTMACEEAVPISLEGPPGMDCYIWSNGSTDSLIIVEQEGLYWLEYWSGCEMGADSFHIIYQNDLFDIDFGDDYTLCGPETILLEAPVIADANYQWQDGSAENNLSVSESGLYWLHVQLNQCSDTDSIYVDQKAIPQLSLGGDTTLCLDHDLRINAYHPDWETYEWQDGSDHAYFDISSSGTYQLSIQNECGSATDEIEVTYFSCRGCPVYIPNVFSPDQSQQNDEFKVFSSCQFLDFQLQIFDRWGNQVYGSDDPEGGWDGLLKGQLCQIGVYAYRLDYKWLDQFNQLQEKRTYGDVLLLR